MDVQLSGPLRPVPIYCRRPFDLDLSPSNHATGSTISTLPRSPEKVKDTIRPSPPQLPVPLLLSASRPECLNKGAVVSPFDKARELSPSNKHGVPLITPVRGPDPRSVALYQTLLRQHPAYHHLLETFLLPPLPPLLCHPAAALCGDQPFTFCAPPSNPPLPRAPPVPVSVDAEKGRVAARPPQSSQPKESPCLPAKEPQNKVGCKASGALSAEELVSSITAVPDPYQQYGYGRKLFPCPQCRYTTDRRNNLKRHMLTMHQLSAKLLECCGVLFRTKAALREHALIFHYHGYTCFYCGRRFCRKALLKRHLSVHNGQKEFICNVCDYATSHKSNLERHRRVHMRQDGEGEMEGDLCHHGHDDVGRFSDDVKSNVSESNSNVDVSCDELSVCSDDEDEEINVHSD